VVTPLALVALAFAAMAYAYFVDRRTVSDADRGARAGAVFPSFEVDRVRRVELTQGKETMVLERGEDREASWTLTSPRHEPADPAAVDTLLRALEQAKRVRTISRGTDLGDLRVRGRMTVDTVVYVFAIGADVAYPPGGAYMSIQGEPPLVVGQALKVQLLRPADTYRSRSLVRYGKSEIGRLELTGARGSVTLERVGETFHLGGLSGLRASRAATDRVLNALADARAETFLDDTGADRALGRVLETVIVVPRHATDLRVEMTVGGACPEGPGEVVNVRLGSTRTSACMARGALEPLDTTADDLLDKALLFARADEIEELELRSVAPDGLALDLARRGTGWHQRAPEDRNLGPEEVDSTNALVVKMAASQALSVQSAAEGPRVLPEARATFVRTGSGSTETLEISAVDAAGFALARRSDDGAVLRLPRAVARRFEPHPIALRGRATWTRTFDPGEVVAIDDTCTPGDERIDLVDGRWQMRSPRGLAADATRTMDLVDALAHAKAEGWIAEADDGSFGLGASACRVTLTLAARNGDGGATSRTMEFGDEADGSIYARTLDDPGVFLAAKTLRTIAQRPVINRGR
jgi:hypothetical protein